MFSIIKVMRKQRKTRYNWDHIQKEYDSGLSYKDLTKKFGLSSNAILKAKNRGALKTRNSNQALLVYNLNNPPRLHTEKTKKKISEARIKYLIENPDKVPYLLNHSSKKSYPEELFEKALLEEKIEGWIYKHRIHIYEYDFAFLDKKIDVEIDGSTHLTEKVKKIDLKRDQWSKDNGWTVLRFTAKQVKQNVKLFLKTLKTLL